MLPAGVGSLDAQVRACADLGVTGYIGVPSYLKALLEHAAGSDRPLKLRRAFVTAEPLPPSLREWLLGHLEVVRQGYGTAETGNLGYECAEMDGWHAPADALVQVCDLTTGEAIYDGDEGQWWPRCCRRTPRWCVSGPATYRPGTTSRARAGWPRRGCAVGSAASVRRSSQRDVPAPRQSLR